jgi:hypothetical protein
MAGMRSLLPFSVRHPDQRATRKIKPGLVRAFKCQFGSRIYCSLTFEEVCNNDLEGIVAKRKHGIYKSNSVGWLKIKNPKYSQAEGRHEMMTRAK